MRNAAQAAQVSSALPTQLDILEADQMRLRDSTTTISPSCYLPPLTDQSIQARVQRATSRYFGNSKDAEDKPAVEQCCALLDALLGKGLGKSRGTGVAGMLDEIEALLGDEQHQTTRDAIVGVDTPKGHIAI